MTQTAADLVKAAEREWKHWGSSTWDLNNNKKHIAHTDDEDAFARYVISNYNKAGGGSPSVQDVMNDHYFWSAVGISFAFQEAGFDKTQFPFAQAHSVWIRKFIAARKDNDTTALYHGYRLTEPQATPDIGDVIGYTYASVSFEKAQKYYDKTTSYPSHTDIVVAKREREIDVIGFNVLDSVTKKTVPLDSKGLIADRSHKWFVVLKRKALH
ncbi:DUF2272 domain-containing protein [Rhizobium panacihumi]|uniref:DUF2272 domain-containing protein n=1 Tax=Rhizobium panacihumi TaxID=2008450 RepID=UPI003D7B91CE